MKTHEALYTGCLPQFSYYFLYVILKYLEGKLVASKLEINRSNKNIQNIFFLIRNLHNVPILYYIIFCLASKIIRQTQPPHKDIFPPIIS